MDDTAPLAERIAGVAYPSFYVQDLDAAEAHWTAFLGAPPEYRENGILGFRLADTWLTLLPAAMGTHPDSGPRNGEIALRVPMPDDVDRLHERLVALGGVARMAPQDTWMYERMRYACIDDPLGIRVDIYCPLPDDAPAEGPTS